MEEDFGELLPMGSEFNIDAAADEAATQIAAKSAANGFGGNLSIRKPGDNDYNADEGGDDGVE